MEDTRPNSAEDFADRFKVLCDDAKSHGVTSFFAVLDDNPLASDGDGEDAMFYSWRGGYYVVLGMLESMTEALRSKKVP